MPLSPNTFFKLLSFICFVVLSSVYFIEYILGHPPCDLCLYQRLPWFGLLIVGLGMLRIKQVSFKKYTSLGLMICLGLMLISTALSGFHTGVEFLWWKGPSTCSGSNAPVEFSALKEALLNAPPVRCDEVSFRILGGSLALWNFNLSLSLSLVFGQLMWKWRND